MAWIYLAESAVSVSPYKIGSGRSPTVNANDIANPFCLVEWHPGKLVWHRSGTTCAHCGENTCPRLTSFTEDSRAKTSAQQDVVRVWQESEADFISKSKGLSAKQNQLSCSLKTSLQSGHADLDVWCGDFPSSGMIVGGRLYQPKRLAPRTFVNDGSYLPTPTACDYGKNNGRNTVNSRDRYSLTTLARHNLWPTPKAADSNPCGMQSMLRYNERTGRKTLITEVAKTIWPTPLSTEGMGGAQDPEKRKAGGHTPRLRDEVGGQLNPTWVEWLMGYPLEWTALEDWAMQWFRPKRAKLSKDSRELEASA